MKDRYGHEVEPSEHILRDLAGSPSTRGSYSNAHDPKNLVDALRTIHGILSYLDNEKFRRRDTYLLLAYGLSGMIHEEHFDFDRAEAINEFLQLAESEIRVQDGDFIAVPRHEMKEELRKRGWL